MKNNKSKKINYRHRLTQINTDKMKRAMPLKIALPAQQKKEKISVNPCLEQKDVIVYVQK
jgi:hypothetical protein